MTNHKNDRDVSELDIARGDAPATPPSSSTSTTSTTQANEPSNAKSTRVRLMGDSHFLSFEPDLTFFILIAVGVLLVLQMSKINKLEKALASSADLKSEPNQEVN